MISVCIATHNGERYLKEQIDSILSQLSEFDEVIISDDNSKDSTRVILETYSDSRIKIFANNFGSVIRNFEFAINEAEGDYIFLSDQDDLWLANKAQRMVQELESGYDLVLCDASIFDSDSKKILQKSFFAFNNSRPGLAHNLIKNSFIGCCLAFNKTVKRKIIPFPKDIPMHDSWIGIVSSVFFNIKFLDETLMLYRKHGGNLSATSAGRSNNSLLKKMKFRISLIKNLLILVLNK